jgi:hypothetical protein
MPRGKLSDGDRAEIRRLRSVGVTQADLAVRFSVTEKTVRSVLNGPQARKPEERKPKPARMPAVRARSAVQLAEEVDRAREALEAVDAAIGADRLTGARAALGNVMQLLGDVARDLELMAESSSTAIADAAFGVDSLRVS